MSSPGTTTSFIDAGSSTGNTTDLRSTTTATRAQLRDRVEIDSANDYDDDDDDMDFVPARERREEDDDDEYESTSEGLSGIDIEFEILGEESEIMDEDDDDENDDDEDDDEDEDEDEGDEGAETETELGSIIDRGGGGRPVFITREQIVRILGANGLRSLLASGGRLSAPFLGGRGGDEDEEEEDEDDDFGFDPRTGRRTRRTRRPVQRMDFEKVPSEEGRKLMLSGKFGGNERGEDSLKRRKRLASRLSRREMGLGSHGRQKARNGLLRQVCQYKAFIGFHWIRTNALWCRT